MPRARKSRQCLRGGLPPYPALLAGILAGAAQYSKGPPIRNFTYKKGCTMFCGRWLRKFVQGKRVGFLATMVLLLCGRQHQPLPIGPGRAVEVIVHFDAQLIQDGASTLLAEARHPFCCHFRRKESPLVQEQRNLPFLAGQSQRKLPTSGR